VTRAIGRCEPCQVREEAALSIGRCARVISAVLPIADNVIGSLRDDIIANAFPVTVMSYVVLARKLRPARFKDLIGQETIAKTLTNAIVSNRVAHAFLFTGPRGTGKTSCARILTKAINCRQSELGEPCNRCENCEEITQGIATDVIEIDAASNRGIEHIRELRENVKFSPAKCQFKTYIIDEVHMLTTESFNALLKTLEEPPSHVKFILATTDHHKIPKTVLSRCQRYDFSSIATSEMVEYLQAVVAREAIEINTDALRTIAQTAAGGMRDALMILDMLVSFCGNRIEEDKVIGILGLNDEKEIDELLEAAVDQDSGRMMALIGNLLSKGRTVTRLNNDLMKAVRDLTLVKTLKDEEVQWYDFLPDQEKRYRALAQRVTHSSLQQYFHILIEVESQARRCNQPQICLEMGLLKMCAVESLVGVAEIVGVLRDAAAQKKNLLGSAL
jgi:DNA polymerase III subunit gamma/tau